MQYSSTVESPPVRIELGSGPHGEPGFFHVDAVGSTSNVDLDADIRQLDFLESESVDEIYSAHAVEHISYTEIGDVLKEWYRVLKPGGQAIYGVPIERRFMVWMFWLMGCNIREHHFSTEKDVFSAADSILDKVRLVQMQSTPSLFGPVYEIGHFAKKGSC